jgi:hypothetical protein
MNESMASFGYSLEMSEEIRLLDGTWSLELDPQAEPETRLDQRRKPKVNISK